MIIEGQYLTYNEYIELGGTLEEMPFKILELEARQSVDKYTFGRLKNREEQNQEVKLLVYRLMTLIESYKSLEQQNKAIASENTDGYSISYSTPSTSTTEAQESEKKALVKEYLIDCKLEDGTPYLYCGADVK